MMAKMMTMTMMNPKMTMMMRIQRTKAITRRMKIKLTMVNRMLSTARTKRSLMANTITKTKKMMITMIVILSMMPTGFKNWRMTF